MSVQIKNRGFILELPHPEDYEFLGATKLKGEKLCLEKQWDKWLPTREIQWNRFLDTFSCVTFAALNCLETIFKRKYGEEYNRSDRFTSKMSGTIPGRGNSIRAVAESIRKAGTVAEEKWPFMPEMNQTEFFLAIPEAIKQLGLDWLQEMEIGYEWTSLYGQVGNKEKMWEALMESPLHTAVDAGSRTENGIVQNDFSTYNHSVMIYGGEYGKNWNVYDSYDAITKIYVWDYPFFSPLKYTLSKKNLIPPPADISNDMMIPLIRDSFTQKIYLLDGENRKHHIEAPDAFMEYIGKSIWDKQQWRNMTSENIDKYPEGKPLSLKSVTFVEAVKILFQQLGAKLGIIRK